MIWLPIVFSTSYGSYHSRNKQKLGKIMHYYSPIFQALFFQNARKWWPICLEVLWSFKTHKVMFKLDVNSKLYPFSISFTWIRRFYETYARSKVYPISTFAKCHIHGGKSYWWSGSVSSIFIALTFFIHMWRSSWFLCLRPNCILTSRASNEWNSIVFMFTTNWSYIAAWTLCV